MWMCWLACTVSLSGSASTLHHDRVHGPSHGGNYDEQDPPSMLPLENVFVKYKRDLWTPVHNADSKQPAEGIERNASVEGRSLTHEGLAESTETELQQRTSRQAAPAAYKLKTRTKEIPGLDQIKKIPGNIFNKISSLGKHSISAFAVLIQRHRDREGFHTNRFHTRICMIIIKPTNNI